MDASLNLTQADADPKAQGLISILAIVANIICITAIIKKSKQKHINPYKNDVFTEQHDFKEAMARAEEVA